MAEWGPGDSALSLVLGTQFFQKMQPHQDSRLWIRRQWNEQPRAHGHGCFDKNVPKPHSTTRLDLRFWSVIYFYFIFPPELPGFVFLWTRVVSVPGNEARGFPAAHKG